jgi:HSP20 family protein
MAKTEAKRGADIAGRWRTAIHGSRDDRAITIQVDMPGIEPDDVKIEIRDDVLTVSGEHEERSEDKGEGYFRRERRYGSFSRSIPLPEGVKADDVKTTPTDGGVEIEVPLPEAES